MNEPRPHHYGFAHRYLPMLAFKFKASFLSFIKKGGESYLRGVWNQFGNTFTKEERLAADGLSLTFFEEERFCGAVITLPVALYQTEVYMVALIAERVSDSNAEYPTAGFEFRNLRYFTLERPTLITSDAGTNVGEWVYQRYINHGSGPVVDAELFWGACTKLALKNPSVQPLGDSIKSVRSSGPVQLGQKGGKNSENLLRFCHPAFWKLGNKND